MRNPILLAAFVTLATMLPAAGELGPPRRVVPPSFGTLPYGVDAWSYDAKNFLISINGGWTFEAGAQQVLLMGPDGTQLTDPAVLPAEAKPIGVTANLYIFTLGDSFLRMSAKGKLLDAAPLPLPVKAVAAVAGPRNFLVIGKDATFLVDPDGTAMPVGAVANGFITEIAAKGDRFAVSYVRGDNFYVLLIDDRGVVLRDGLMPDGTRNIYSDGNTWLLNRRTSPAPYEIADDDLNALLTINTRHFLFPVPGRGYIGVIDRQPVFGGATVPAEVFEVRAPQYAGQQTRLEDWVFGSSVIRGNPYTLLYLDRTAYPTHAHLLSSVAELKRPLLGPELSFSGALDREAPVAATNSAGVSLLVWTEPAAPASVSIYAARVSATGTVLDANPVLLAEDCPGSQAAIATDGTDFLVGWSGCAQAGAHLFSATGTVTRSVLALKVPGDGSNAPAVAFDGNGYFFSWPDRNATFIARVERNGTAVRPAMKLYASSMRIAPLQDGGALLLYRTNRLMSQHLTPEVRLDGEATPVLLAAAYPDSVTREGDHFLLIGRRPDGGSLVPFLMRLDHRGNPSATQPLGVPIATAGAHVFCDAECMLVWKDGTASTATRIVASTIGKTAADGVTLTTPVTVATHDAIFRIFEPVLLRGSVNDPRLLLYTAPDRESGAVQIFARSSATKRRASRP
jgi:hypothetical protein